MSYPPPPGYPVPQPHGYMPVAPNSGMATASMVLGILGIFTCGITSIVAVVLGHVGEGQTRHGRMMGRGQAIAGLILGYFVLAPWIIFWVMVLMGAATAPFIGGAAAVSGT